MNLQVREGHFYRTRGGEVVGPIEWRDGSFWSTTRQRVTWWALGGLWQIAENNEMDLVEDLGTVVNPAETTTKGNGNILLTGEHKPVIFDQGDLEDDNTDDLAAETFAPLATILTMRATEIAGKASDLVGGDRDRQHGAKRDNFTRIATTWNAWLAIRKDPAAPLDAHDVGVMMSMMKLARTQSGNLNIDDYIDACGYAACAGEVAQQG